MENLIEVKNLKKYFKTNGGMLHAVDDVSFGIPKGTTMGVVGESGCGKSTLGRTMIHLLESTDGHIIFEGQDVTNLTKRETRKFRESASIIFQDPYSSLDPRYTVERIIREPLDISKKYSKKEVQERVDQLMDMVGIDPRLTNAYPHELDGGRRQRIGIARALALGPKFIVCDEPVSALDVSIQAQVLNLLQDLQEEHGLTYMFVTHNMSVVRHISNKICVMYLGQLVETMNAVTEEEIDALMAVYKESYDFATDDLETVRYQAREEIAMKKMMDAEGCKAFSNTFQDLYGMKQLPGLASQHLMAQGYGYGGEGDWKVAAMTSILKVMGENGNGASAFMEDYTYHLVPGHEYSLGAHMLEVCPSVASARPRIEVHPLGIGDREDPARLVFEGKEGDAMVVSLIDMGGRLRLICQDIHCVKPIMPMPNLPVARVMWQAEPSLTTGLECWITAGGAHHTVLTYDVSAEQMKDWANMMDIEFVHISKDTTVEGLEQQLFLNDLAWKLK